MKLYRTVVTLVLAAALAVPLLPTQASAATMYHGHWTNQVVNQTQSGNWYGTMEYGSRQNTNWQGSCGWGWSNKYRQGWGCWW